MEVIASLRGLDRLLEAERTVGAKTEGALTDHLLRVGGQVAEDTRKRYLDYSVEGAYGVQPKVFATSGLWVVQTRKKTRNVMRQRPNFGPLMMRKSFLPAARENEPRVLLAAKLAVKEASAAWDAA